MAFSGFEHWNIWDYVGTQLDLPNLTSKRFTASFLHFSTTIFYFIEYFLYSCWACQLSLGCNLIFKAQKWERCQSSHLTLGMKANLGIFLKWHGVSSTCGTELLLVCGLMCSFSPSGSSSSCPSSETWVCPAPSDGLQGIHYGRKKEHI